MIKSEGGWEVCETPSLSLSKNHFDPGQGVVFRCWTTRTDVSPRETASKVYFDTSYMNMTQLELVNTAVNQTGVRPTLYMFHEYGYVEEWLGDYKENGLGA